MGLYKVINNWSILEVNTGRKLSAIDDIEYNLRPVLALRNQ